MVAVDQRLFGPSAAAKNDSMAASSSMQQVKPTYRSSWPAWPTTLMARRRFWRSAWMRTWTSDMTKASSMMASMRARALGERARFSGIDDASIACLTVTVNDSIMLVTATVYAHAFFSVRDCMMMPICSTSWYQFAGLGWSDGSTAQTACLPSFFMISDFIMASADSKRWLKQETKGKSDCPEWMECECVWDIVAVCLNLLVHLIGVALTSFWYLRLPLLQSVGWLELNDSILHPLCSHCCCVFRAIGYEVWSCMEAEEADKTDMVFGISLDSSMSACSCNLAALTMPLACHIGRYCFWPVIGTCIWIVMWRLWWRCCCIMDKSQKLFCDTSYGYKVSRFDSATLCYLEFWFNQKQYSRMTLARLSLWIFTIYKSLQVRLYV